LRVQILPLVQGQRKQQKTGWFIICFDLVAQ
jgi:hypothetical protein